MSRDPAEERLERETEEYERQLREDRRADHTPAPRMSRAAVIPVLLGGHGHGKPFNPDLPLVLLDWPQEGDEPEETRYVEHAYAPPAATRKLRLYAWEALTEGEALALAWDWLLDRALPEPRPIAAADFERPPTGDELRHVEAIEAVLRRRLPGLTDQTVRSMAEECLAAADTGI